MKARCGKVTSKYDEQTFLWQFSLLLIWWRVRLDQMLMSVDDRGFKAPCIPIWFPRLLCVPKHPSRRPHVFQPRRPSWDRPSMGSRTGYVYQVWRGQSPAHPIITSQHLSGQWSSLVLGFFPTLEREERFWSLKWEVLSFHRRMNVWSNFYAYRIGLCFIGCSGCLS